MQQKKIIIIGASSGIGREMAVQYARQQHLVGITGRRKELLQQVQQLFPHQVHISCFDVTAENSRQHLEELIHRLGGMDLLIYNAGFGEPSDMLEPETETATTQTNVGGFIALVPFAFRYFVQQGQGQIAVTSSIAALRGNSWAPAYSASKAFLSNYAEGLNIQAGRLQKDIVVTDLKPGFINTKQAKGHKRFWVAPPEKAARQIIRAIEEKKRVAYITRRWWLIAKLLQLLPYAWYKRLG